MPGMYNILDMNGPYDSADDIDEPIILTNDILIETMDIINEIFS